MVDRDGLDGLLRPIVRMQRPAAIVPAPSVPTPVIAPGVVRVARMPRRQPRAFALAASAGVGIVGIAFVLLLSSTGSHTGAPSSPRRLPAVAPSKPAASPPPSPAPLAPPRAPAAAAPPPTHVVTLPLHFRSGASVSLPLSRAGRAELARALQSLDVACGPAPLELVGHTDALGPDDSNQSLGRERAEHAALFLAGRLDGRSIVATSAGSSQPVASNATPDGRRANRRVTALCHPPSTP